jgi:hypothetical protein
MGELNSFEEIGATLNSGEPVAVVGLNGRGNVQIELPPGCNYIEMTGEQALEMAAKLMKHAARSKPR